LDSGKQRWIEKNFVLTKIIVNITIEFLNGKSGLLIMKDVKRKYVRATGRDISDNCFYEKLDNADSLGILSKLPNSKGKSLKANSETVEYVSKLSGDSFGR